METGPHLLTAGEPSQATNPTKTPTETQMMLLTGPETETQDTIQVPIPAEPSNSSPTYETLQTSTPLTAEYSESRHESVTKAEKTTSSARRQLLMDHIEEQPTEGAKRPKQGE